MAWLMSPLSEVERQSLVQLLNKIQQQASKFPAAAAPVAVAAG
jgi:hypothetical protein